MDDDFDDYVEDVEDVVEPEEDVELLDSDRPMKRSKSLEGEGGAAPDDEFVVDGIEVWQRPVLPDLNPATHPLTFHWMAIDICGGDPLKANPAPGRGVAGSKNAPVPILHVYGVTDSGHSVLCRIHGFTPYFYFAAPPGITMGHLPSIKAALEHSVRVCVCGWSPARPVPRRCVCVPPRSSPKRRAGARNCTRSGSWRSNWWRTTGT